ncbi:hypothetical protein CPC08DRAFT_763086 [Agrocybe pediades]|nr:hypothetical protein CPC08DRAFT_763086 [Agrocybe pediades]
MALQQAMHFIWRLLISATRSCCWQILVSSLLVIDYLLECFGRHLRKAKGPTLPKSQHRHKHKTRAPSFEILYDSKEFASLQDLAMIVDDLSGDLTKHLLLHSSEPFETSTQILSDSKDKVGPSLYHPEIQDVHHQVSNSENIPPQPSLQSLPFWTRAPSVTVTISRPKTRRQKSHRRKTVDPSDGVRGETALHSTPTVFLPLENA